MKLSRERAIYLTVLGVGVSALALGEVVFPSSPSNAAGAPPGSSNEYAVPRPVEASKPAPAAKGSGVSRSVAEQLLGYQQAHAVELTEIRDVFKMPASMDHSAVASEKPAVVEVNAAERFQQEHRLNGVMVADRRGKAIVDGKIVHLGQTLDGFKLVAVDHEIAVFESGTGQVVLRIPQGSGGAAGAASHK